MNIKQLIDSIRGMTPTALDDVAARSVELYPEWKSGIEITQDNWRPGQATASLRTAIDVTYAGTLEDPIPFALNMEIFKDKYYTWEGKIYLCTRDSGIALQNPPGQLIGHYFTEA